MKIAIYTYSDSFTLDLAIELIPKGIEPIECSTKEEFLAIIEHDDDIKIVLSESFEIELLEKIKSLRPNVYIFLIIHQSFKPQEVMKLMKIGITSLIEFDENISAIGENLVENIIRLNLHSKERRLHVRITPNPYEQTSAAIYIKDLNRFVKGEIIDISAGGTAVKLYDSIEASMLSVNSIYDPLIIQIRGMDIRTISKMMGKRDSMAGFRFENVEIKDMRNLSSYIHMRISEKSKKFIQSIMQTKLL